MSYKLMLVMPDGSSSELQINTMNYSSRHEPINAIGSYEPVEYMPPIFEFTISGFMGPVQMAELRKADYLYRGLRSRLEPEVIAKKRDLHQRRAELLQQLLDTFKEKKDEQD